MTILAELRLLGRLRRQMLKNEITHPNKEKILRFIMLLSISVIFFALDYIFFARIISYIARIDVLDMVEIGSILVARLLSMILLLFFSMLIFSNIVTSLATLYLSSDLPLLLSSPVRFSSVFVTKYIETTLNSSLILMVFGLPVFIVCGLEYHAAWSYYFMIPITLTPFIMLPASLGSMLTMLLVRFFPVKRVQQAFVVFGLILGGGLVLLFRFLRPEQLIDDIGMQQLLTYIQQNRIPTAAYLPSTWAAEVFMSFLERHYLAGLMNLGWLFLAAVGGYLALLWLAQAIYYAGWAGTAESRTVQVLTRSSLSERALRRLAFFHPVTRALIIKDIKLFWRDTTQWSQLLMLAALLLIYFFNIISLPLRNMFIKNVVSFLNLGMSGFVLASLGARFIFPSTSLEGQSFWVIHAAPVEYRRFLREKFFIFLFPLLALAETLVVISNLILQVGHFMMLLSVVTIFFITVGLTGLGVGMGAIYPKFINENPAQIAMSIGGILYMILSLLFIGVIIVLEAWPVYVYFSHNLFERATQGGIWQYLAYTLVVALSLGVTILPLYLGVKRLQRFEII